MNSVGTSSQHTDCRRIRNQRASSSKSRETLVPTSRMFLCCLVFACLLLAGLTEYGHTQKRANYEPVLESLDRHALPQWYADAKLGIFIHWGLYSVPGWAPLVHPEHDFQSADYIVNNPYAEWYLNTMRLDGSPTQAYHREHYGANYDYYNFAGTFNSEILKWDPLAWAELFEESGARYVVLTTKHHDGFTLWPSATPNPTLPPGRQHATRDIVGELTTAVNRRGLRMGLYYSGGYDWTFVPGPIRAPKDYETVKPQSESYGKYVDAHFRELIARYHPAVLWNDIDYPKSGQPLQIMAEYYNAVPDGVVDDRFGVRHSDFTSPEYQTLDKISATKWEECRGLGRSFGYNRAEGEAETIAPDQLVFLLVDIVSKNGNLLLDVGPEADGTIPAVQLSRLKALGSWLKTNGEAIYATTPWKRPASETVDGLGIRFTQGKSDVFATLLGQPKKQSITIKGLSFGAETQVHLLGYEKALVWSRQQGDIAIELPSDYQKQLAYVIRITGPIS
jgi:alpha-L-fucosidase